MLKEKTKKMKMKCMCNMLYPLIVTSSSLSLIFEFYVQQHQLNCCYNLAHVHAQTHTHIHIYNDF